MIFVVPDETPPNKPVEELIVPMAVLLLVQVPPLVADDNVAVAPGQRLVVPVIAEGFELREINCPLVEADKLLIVHVKVAR